MKYYFLWLSLICIGMFFVQMAVPASTDALLLNSHSWTQPWRFVSAIFLHASPEHLILNMFALLLFGFILEKLIGSNKFLFVFFASGIFANLIAVNFYSASLGASGAIYGILGALALIKPMMTVWTYSLPMPMIVAAVIWIGVSVFGILNPSTTGDIAHLSGIAVGAIFGLYFRLKKKDEKLRQPKIIIPEEYAQSWEQNYMR